MADVSSSNSGHSLRCPMDMVFFQLGLKTETEQEIVVAKMVFRLLGTERTQTPNTNCGGSTRTRNDDRKRPHVFKHTFF